MSSTTDDSVYDLVILGGGSGGYACAFRAAQLGLSVALVEQDKLGGTCLHRGCIPTKALLHAAEVADSARHGARFGVNTSLESIDMAGVHAYKDGVVGRLHKGLTGLAGQHEIELVPGTGRLTSPTTIEVDGRVLTGRSIVLATGSRPRLIPGLELSDRVVTSDQALTLDHVPASVVVLGGGVIGVEFASVFASFGAQVTIVEALPRLLATEDEAASTQLQRAFRKRKIDVRTSTRFTSVEDAGTDSTSGPLRVHVETQDGAAQVLDTDLLLVSVGRGPVTENLGYEQAGVELDGGFVRTDDRLRTSVPGIFAVGDIVPGPQLAHRGFAQGMFVAEEIAGLEPSRVPDEQIPRVTYCEPEVASVGLTEAAARERHGHGVETVEYNLGGNGKSQILQTQGFVKLVRTCGDGQVVGVHLVGSRMGEQIGEAQLIVGWDATADDVADLVHAHPTQNEALGEAHLALAGRPLHSHA